MAGLAGGASFAVLGLALTITYQATRCVNFASAGIGAFGAFVLASLSAHHVPNGIGLAAGIVAGSLLSLLLGGVLVRWFDDADVASKSVVTIGALLGMIAVASLVFGGEPQPVPVLFSSSVVTISSVPITVATVLLIVISAVTAAGVRVILTRTRVGKRLRAISERSRTAEMLGLPSRTYGLVVWALAGAFEVIAIVLIASSSSTDFGDLSFQVIPALAAGLFGLFRSFGATVVAGIIMGLAEGVLTGYSSTSQYATIAPFIALLLVLVVSQRGQRWEDAR